jgi:hypothetical protein
MIYFLQSGENGPIKIGHTEGHVVWRMRQLQHSSPYELSILGIHAGDHSEEQRLHRKFSADRFRNEWFNPVPSILKHIDDMGGLEAFHRLDRTDLRDATEWSKVRRWPDELRAKYRFVKLSLGRPYSAWREYMALPSEEVCAVLENFLTLHNIPFTPKQMTRAAA